MKMKVNQNGMKKLLNTRIKELNSANLTKKMVYKQVRKKFKQNLKKYFMNNF